MHVHVIHEAGNVYAVASDRKSLESVAKFWLHKRFPAKVWSKFFPDSTRAEILGEIMSYAPITITGQRDDVIAALRQLGGDEAAEMMPPDQSCDGDDTMNMLINEWRAAGGMERDWKPSEIAALADDLGLVDDRVRTDRGARITAECFGFLLQPFVRAGIVSRRRSGNQSFYRLAA